MKQLHIQNRQRVRPLNARWARRAARALLDGLLQVSSYELAVHFISARRMAALNEHFLGHEGSTDVITFDYREDYGPVGDAEVAGEIFISVEDAIAQSAEFQRPWEEEIMRYLVHGVLHLRGYDDTSPPLRKRMKTEEERLLKQVLRDLG